MAWTRLKFETGWGKRKYCEHILLVWTLAIDMALNPSVLMILWALVLPIVAATIYTATNNA